MLTNHNLQLSGTATKQFNNGSSNRNTIHIFGTCKHVTSYKYSSPIGAVNEITSKPESASSGRRCGSRENEEASAGSVEVENADGPRSAKSDPCQWPTMMTLPNEGLAIIRAQTTNEMSEELYLVRTLRHIIETTLRYGIDGLVSAQVNDEIMLIDLHVRNESPTLDFAFNLKWKRKTKQSSELPCFAYSRKHITDQAWQRTTLHSQRKNLKGIIIYYKKVKPSDSNLKFKTLKLWKIISLVFVSHGP